MGVSGDFESIVSGRVINRKLGALPLTVDLFSGRAGFQAASELPKFVKEFLLFES